LLPFAARIAERGMIFSLAQTVLRLTSPGIPDLYQGNEIWDFSLVDPDNRRPVDFESRIELLAGLDSRSPGDSMEKWHDGGIKMHVVRTLLHLRRELTDLFVHGAYHPLTATGPRSDCVAAFLRTVGSSKLLVIVPRRIGPGPNLPSGAAWTDSQILLDGPYEWKNVFTGQKIQQRSNPLSLDLVFSDLPVAVLMSP
jgi:(1->4)-alpha-D-glucan 1-alpha-D-glucosylmutase